MNLRQMSGVIPVFGMRGRGKTLACASLVELDERIVIFDNIGALSEYSKKEPYYIIDVKIWLPTHKSQILGRALSKIFNKYHKIIFNLQDLNLSELVSFYDFVIPIMLKIEDRKSMTVIFDEIADVLPQQGGHYSKELERFLRVGRNKGWVKVLATTQRLQSVAKIGISQADTYLIFGMKHNLDLRTLQQLLGMTKTDFAGLSKIIKRLDIGEFLVSDGVEIEGVYMLNIKNKEFEKVREYKPSDKVKLPEGVKKKELIIQMWRQGKKGVDIAKTIKTPQSYVSKIIKEEKELRK